MNRIARVAFALLAAASAAGPTIQAKGSATHLPPRELARAETESPERLLSAIEAVRATSRGTFFVYDRASRHVLMLDRDLRPIRAHHDVREARR